MKLTNIIDPNSNNSYKTKKKFTGSYTEVNPFFYKSPPHERAWRTLLNAVFLFVRGRESWQVNGVKVEQRPYSFTATSTRLEQQGVESMRLYNNKNDGCNHVHAHLTLNIDSLFHVTNLRKLTRKLFDDGISLNY